MISLTPVLASEVYQASHFSLLRLVLALFLVCDDDDVDDVPLSVGPALVPCKSPGMPKSQYEDHSTPSPL